LSTAARIVVVLIRYLLALTVMVGRGSVPFSQWAEEANYHQVTEPVL
jgi:hypothetical protein